MTELNPKQHKFIDEFIHCQVEEKAAISAGYKGFWGKRLRAIPMIAAEIDRRLAILHTEQAKQTIKKRELCKELLDDELTSLIKIDVKDVIEKPALGATKREAIEMGYRRTGMLAGGEFIPEIDPAAVQQHANEAPRIFKATQTSMLQHRIIETTQTVTKEVVADSSPYDF